MSNDDLSIKHTVSSPVTSPMAEEAGTVTTTPPPTLSVDASETGNVATASHSASMFPDLIPPNSMNPATLMTTLYTLQRKVQESHISDAEENINQRAADKDMKNKEIVGKLEKMIKDATKSKAGSLCAKIFGWVGVALAFVVAGVVAAVSGGTAAAPLFILATVALAIMIAQETGGMDKMEDAMGMDDKQKMIFSICLTVTMLVLNIGATVASGGAAGVSSIVSSVTNLMTDAAGVAAEGGAAAAEGAAAAAEGASAAAEGAAAAAEGVGDTVEVASTAAEGATETAIEGSTQAAEEAASTATKEAAEGGSEAAGKAAGKSARFMRNANRVRAGAQVLSGGASIAGGSASIDAARAEHDGTIARSDMMRAKAELAKMTALDEEDMRKIREMIDRLQNMSTMVLDTISSADETATKIRSSV